MNVCPTGCPWFETCPKRHELERMTPQQLQAYREKVRNMPAMPQWMLRCLDALGTSSPVEPGDA